MNLPIMEQTFISAKASFAEAKAIILGCPYDGSATFRPGARFGPSAIRKASWGIETYSPYQESDLTQIKIHDMGDLELPLGEKKTSLRLIQEGARRILSAKKIPILLGGDHLITLPMIEEVLRVYPDVHVLHIDAHTDLRDEYLGETLNHSTVMKKVLNLLSKGRLSQVGVRSGTREEFALAEKIRSILFFDPKSIIRIVNRLKHRPVYISLDLDVMDPGLLSGVGTPEPGGFTFQELISLFKGLQPLRVIGFDLVELTPDYDPTQISSVTASVILREMILAFCP